MSRRWALLGCLVLVVPPVRAQVVAGAQIVGRGAPGAAVLVGGLLGWTIGARDRLLVGGTVGGGDGSGIVRAEVLWRVLAAPRHAEFTPYLAAGLAAERFRSDSHGRVVGALGVEFRPAGRRGAFVEAGFGGGWRAAVGYQWRWVRRQRAGR